MLLAIKRRATWKWNIWEKKTKVFFQFYFLEFFIIELCFVSNAIKLKYKYLLKKINVFINIFVQLFANSNSNASRSNVGIKMIDEENNIEFLAKKKNEKHVEENP